MISIHKSSPHINPLYNNQKRNTNSNKPVRLIFWQDIEVFLLFNRVLRPIHSLSIQDMSNLILQFLGIESGLSYLRIC